MLLKYVYYHNYNNNLLLLLFFRLLTKCLNVIIDDLNFSNFASESVALSLKEIITFNTNSLMIYIEIKTLIAFFSINNISL